MKIALGSDHAGSELRNEIKLYLENKNYEILDCGTFKEVANYATEGIKVGENISYGNADLGILICGTGIGISIAANKVRGIRAAIGYNEEVAKLSRLHNNANVLAIGARFVNHDNVFKIIDAFLTSEFEGGRHEIRVDTILDYEDSCIDCF